MNNLKDYLVFEKLGEVKDFDALVSGKGCLFDKNGLTTAFYHNGEGMKYLAYIEFSPEKARGDHYHKRKYENICIISGNIKAKYWLPDDSNEIIEIRLSPGDVVHIKPGVAHSYLAETKTFAVEYSPQNFELNDTIDVECNW